MLSRKNLDELSTESRDFYERAYMKLNLSLIFGAFGMMFLGMTAASGAISQAAGYRYSYYDNFVDDNQKTAQNALSSGNGFGCFVFLLATILSFSMAIYLSPFVGSKNEGNIVRTPQDIEQTRGPNDVAVAKAVSDIQYTSNQQYNPNPIATAQPMREDIKPGFEKI